MKCNCKNKINKKKKEKRKKNAPTPDLMDKINREYDFFKKRVYFFGSILKAEYACSYLSSHIQGQHIHKFP